MSAPEDRPPWVLGLVLVVVILALTVGVYGAYEAGKSDGRRDACTTGKVYAIDSSEVNIAASALKVAMLPSTPKASRDYLIVHATELLGIIGQAGPLQVECS